MPFGARQPRDESRNLQLRLLGHSIDFGVIQHRLRLDRRFDGSAADAPILPTLAGLPSASHAGFGFLIE